MTACNTVVTLVSEFSPSRENPRAPLPSQEMVLRWGSRESRAMLGADFSPGGCPVGRWGSTCCGVVDATPTTACLSFGPSGQAWVSKGVCPLGNALSRWRRRGRFRWGARPGSISSDHGGAILIGQWF